jgi:hypothetical protein
MFHKSKQEHSKLGFVSNYSEFELELIYIQMAQKPVLQAEVGMRVRCANKASAGKSVGVGHSSNSSENLQKARYLWVLRTPQNNKEEEAPKQGSSRHPEHEVPLAEAKVCHSARELHIALPLCYKML